MSDASVQQHSIEVRKASIPEGIDANDPEARRAWQQRLADSRVLHQGRLAHEAVMLAEDGSQQIIPLDEVVRRGDETHAAAILFHLLARPQAICVFRRGELHLMGFAAGGIPARYATVMELWAAPDGEVQTWTSMRRVGVGEAGTGTLLDPWQVDIKPVERVVPALQDWVHPGDVSIELLHEGVEEEVAPPRIEMQIVMRQGGAAAPRSAAGFADEVGMLTDVSVVDEGVHDLRIFAFKGDYVECWRVSGELPCSVDEVVRNIAAWSSPDAIGLLAPGVATCPDGVTRRGAFTLVEFEGQRFERVLPVYLAEDGSRSAPHALCRDQDPVNAETGWLGVKPRYDLGLHVKPGVNAPGVIGES